MLSFGKLRVNSIKSNCENSPSTVYSVPFWREPKLPSYRQSKVPNMYAVVKTGGKQYKVASGEKLKIEQLQANVGDAINLDQVLLVADGDAISVGTPTVPGAVVSAKVLSHGRGKKVRIFKLRRRKHYKKQQGHRQNYTELLIEKITA